MDSFGQGKLIQALASAVKNLRRRLRVSATATAMLAIGLLSVTIMFSVLDTLVFRPVPFPDAERLLRLTTRRTGTPLPVFASLKAATVFEQVEAAAVMTRKIRVGTRELDRRIAVVSPGFLTLLDVVPLHGRLFTSEDGRSGVQDRALISERLLQAVFAGAPDVTGRQIAFDGRPVQVIGVLPWHVRLPTRDTDVWIPADFVLPPGAAPELQPEVYVKIAPGIDPDTAVKVATSIAHQVRPDLPGVFASPLATGVASTEGEASAVVLLILAIVVCIVMAVNVASLLLADVIARGDALRLQALLGASANRLRLTAALEYSMLAAAATCAAIVVAGLVVEWAGTQVPAVLSTTTLGRFEVGYRGVGVALVVSILAFGLAAIVPVWSAGRYGHPPTALTTGRHGGSRSLRIILGTQISGACLLLVLAGLLTRSFIELTTASRGLSAEGISFTWVGFDASTSTGDRRQALAAVEDALLGLAGVSGAAASLGQPPNGIWQHSRRWRAEGGSGDLDLEVSAYFVSPAFFELYGIAVVKGRPLVEAEQEPGAVVSERLAAIFWPDADPIGRRFSRGGRQFRVVGVARELRVPSLDPSIDRPEYYAPLAAAEDVPMGMISLRCQPCPSDDDVLARVRTVASVTPTGIQRLQDAYHDHLAIPMVASALASIFAAVAVCTASFGVFAITSHAVNRRNREFGIRVAIGASGARVRWLVLREVATIVGIGSAAASLVAWISASSLSALFYGIGVSDPLAWGAAIGIVVVAAALGVVGPVRRATGVDPASLLRSP